MSLSVSSYVRQSRRIVLRATTLLALSLAMSGPALAQGAAPRVKLATSAGDIVLELAPEKAPKTVANFLQYVRDKHYDGTVFHRVIDGFMIQGGDPLGTGTGGPGYTFDDEINPGVDFTQPYVLAMANAGTRGGKGTNGSQFFITLAPTTWLQGKHTIFGEVADEESRKVVDAIAAVRTGAMDRPVEPVVVESVEISG